MIRIRRIFRRKKIFRLLLFLLIFVILINAFTAFTAGNSVSSSYLHESRTAVDPDTMLPQACIDAGITDVDDYIVVQPGVTAEGTDAPELFLGTTGTDWILGRGGADCIMGGAGNDRVRFLIWWIPTLWGGDGYDVVIGGPGTDLCSGEVLVDCE